MSHDFGSPIQFDIFPTFASLGLRIGSVWAGRAPKTHYRYLGDLSAKRQEERVGQTGDFGVSSLSLLAFEVKRVFRVATGLFPTCYK